MKDGSALIRPSSVKSVARILASYTSRSGHKAFHQVPCCTSSRSESNRLTQRLSLLPLQTAPDSDATVNALAEHHLLSLRSARDDSAVRLKSRASRRAPN